MFGKKRRALEKRIANLESRIEKLETVRTPEYGNIPTSQLWKHIDKFVRKQIKTSVSMDLNDKLDMLVRLATKGECKLTAHGPVIRLHRTENQEADQRDHCSK